MWRALKRNNIWSSQCSTERPADRDMMVISEEWTVAMEPGPARACSRATRRYSAMGSRDLGDNSRNGGNKARRRSKIVLTAGHARRRGHSRGWRCGDGDERGKDRGGSRQGVRVW